MAPKAAKKPALTAEQQQAQDDADHILSKAISNGVATADPLPCDTTLALSKVVDCILTSTYHAVVVKANAKDILKKSTTRKNRYLMILNCKLAPAAGGKLGTLAHLDSKNPVLYLDFRQGRLKLLGSLVFPRNKLLVLRAGQGDSVLAEDVFENVVVFSEAIWVGSAEANPEELRLDMPPELLADKVHEGYEYCYGAGRPEGDDGGQARKGKKRPAAGAAGGGDSDADDDIEILDDDEDDVADVAGEAPPSARKSERHVGRQRRKYIEDSNEEELDGSEEDSDGEGEDEYDSDDSEKEKKQAGKGKAAGKRSSAAAGIGSQEPGSELPRQPKRAATKRTYKLSDSDEEDGEQGDGDSDGDAAAQEDAGPSSKAGTGSKRAAACQGGKARGASAGAKPLPLPLTITLDSDIEGTPAAASGRPGGRKAPAKGTPASAINLLSDSDGEGKPSSRRKPAGKAAASSVKKQAAGGFRLKPLAGLQEEEGAGEGEGTPAQRKAGGSSKKDSAAAGAAAPPSSSRRTPGRTASAAARQKLSEVADSDDEEEEEGGEASGSDGGASEEGSDYMDDE